MIITLIICVTIVLIVAIVTYYNYKINTEDKIIDRLDTISMKLTSIFDRTRDIEGHTYNIDGATSDIQDILEGKHKTED